MPAHHLHGRLRIPFPHNQHPLAIIFDVRKNGFKPRGRTSGLVRHHMGTPPGHEDEITGRKLHCLPVRKTHMRGSLHHEMETRRLPKLRHRHRPRTVKVGPEIKGTLQAQRIQNIVQHVHFAYRPVNFAGGYAIRSLLYRNPGDVHIRATPLLILDPPWATV